MNFAESAISTCFWLPCRFLLFRDIAQTNLYEDFELSFVLYCAGVTTLVFLGVWFLAAHILKDKSLVGAFAQASVRSSAAILGIAFVENMYGNAGLAPLMIGVRRAAV